MRSRWFACLTLGAGLVVTGCGSGDDAAGRVHELLIDVDRQSGRSFTAEGAAVDQGLVCPVGRWRTGPMGFTALDGSPMTLEEFGPLREAAIDADPPDVTIGYLLDVELDCADGSGAIGMIVEERNDGPWEITSGTGAYRSLTGSGTLQVERDPPSEEWHPPGGVPHWNHLTGTVVRSG